MTFDTYRTMWKALVEAGSACLLACGGVWDPASAACQRLRQISHESGELRVALALSHPTRLTSYHYAMGQVRTGAYAGSGHPQPLRIGNRRPCLVQADSPLVTRL